MKRDLRLPTAVVAVACVLAGCTKDAPAPSTPAAATPVVSPTTSTPVVSPTSTAGPSPSRTSTGGSATLVEQMAASVERATSVRFRGTLAQGDTPVTVDMTTTADKDAKGSVDFGSGKVRLIATGGEVYLKAPAAVWNTQGVKAAALPAVTDKWVRVPAASAARFRVFTDFKYLLSGFTDTTYTAGPATGDTTQLVDAKGTRVTVQTRAPYLPVRVTDADERRALAFDRWNKSPRITAPDNAVDLTKAGQ